MKRIIRTALTAMLCLTAALLIGCASTAAEPAPPADTTPAVSDTAIAEHTSEAASDEVQEGSFPEESSTEITANAEKISLSGDPADEFVAESSCYTEGEQVVLYFRKGITVKGDMLVIAEKAMADIATDTGLSYEFKREPIGGYTDFMSLYGLEDFRGINADNKKINIYVVDPEEQTALTFDNSVIIGTTDFSMEDTSLQTLYHELVHVIHLRNGVSLGSTLTEGYAEYICYRTLMKNKTPVWSMVQYFGGNDQFDEQLVYGGEEAFRHIYDARSYNYQYGFRFVTFLYKNYGENVFVDILSDATARNYDDAFSEDPADLEADNAQLVGIIKENISDDVFERFADWYKKNWSAVEDDFRDYMSSIGQLVP